MCLRARAAYLDVWGRVFVLLNALYHVSTYRNTIQIHPYLSLVYNSSSTATMCLRNRIRQTHTRSTHTNLYYFIIIEQARDVCFGAVAVYIRRYIYCVHGRLVEHVLMLDQHKSAGHLTFCEVFLRRWQSLSVKCVCVFWVTICYLFFFDLLFWGTFLMWINTKVPYRNTDIICDCINHLVLSWC